MRQALNENPVVQLAVVGVLALVVGFLLITRVMGGGSEPPTTAPADESTTTSAAPTTPAPADGVEPAAGDAAAPAESTTAPPTESGTVPSDSAATAPAPAGAAETTAPAASEATFLAGRGLPVAVVRDWVFGDVVVLLVTRRAGIDDQKLRESVAAVSRRPDVALFETTARDVSRYSRIAEGLDLNRVPALIVLQPIGLADDLTPQATVSYGYRGPDSVEQAIRDATYAGKDNLPYYPQ